MTAMLLAQVAGVGDAIAQNPAMALPLLFAAGVLTSLTPCVYPMIPITASVIAGTTTADTPRRRVVALTLTYVVGLATFYALLGLIAGLSGHLFGTISANPWARLAIGNLLLVFALGMFGVLPIRVPDRLGSWVAGLRGGTFPAVFLLGATSGIVAAPCGAPVFAAVLTWVSTTRSGALGFLYLFVFSLGMTTLLVVVGLSSGAMARLPKSGMWMVWVKRAAGVLLLIMAQYYFVQAGLVL
jgi:cytochrome c-type biogenesis protein